MIVITGAAGFIGSCILAKFNEIGRDDILIVDHLDNELKKGNLKNKKYKKYFDKEEFLNFILEDKIKENVDIVIHMGACSSTTLQDAQYFQKNNFEYSCHLAQWALNRNARFIYASSAATYGDGSKGYSDDHSLLQQYQPLNLYGKSKQQFDEWVLENSFLDRVVGLKFFNVYGPNEYHKGDMRSVMAKTYKSVVEEGKVRLFKSYKKEYAHGEQKRDFIYIKDAVDIVTFFVENPEICGIYNVGTGKARSWNGLANACFSAAGKKGVIEYFDMPEELKARYQYFTQAEMTKLRNSGYQKSFTELEEGAQDYFKYLVNQTYI